MFRGVAEISVVDVEELSFADQSDQPTYAKCDAIPDTARPKPNFLVDAALSIDHSRHMDISRATTIMSALAQPTRLRTYRLLVEHGEVGLASGAIATAVGAPQNTMSSHLTILSHAGLVRREQQGRVVRYRAVLDEVAALGAFLIE
jgi:DNA-binding transcriptional ArsR family regulator